MANTAGNDMQDCKDALHLSSSQVLVAGLRWNSGKHVDTSAHPPANLDLSCVLLNLQDQIIDCVHPGRPRAHDDSVLHTGDSRTGGGEWDDERVFIFLEALPQAVSTVILGVTNLGSVDCCETCDVWCHVTNHDADQELLRLQLKRNEAQRSQCIATLARARDGWKVAPGEQSNPKILSLLEGCRDREIHNGNGQPS